MKLNLGSGTNRRADYLSVDKYIPEADEHWDLTEPLPVDDESVEAILAIHVIEHFERAEWERMSKDWIRVLKPKGTIEIYCPDLVKVCRAYLAEPNNDYRIKQLYGLQSTPGEFHKNGFTSQTLIDSFLGLTAEYLPPSDDTELHMRFTK